MRSYIHGFHWLQALSEELKGSKGTFHYVKTDVTKESEIVAAFDNIKKNIGGVDIMINNAGIGTPTLVKGKYNFDISDSYRQNRSTIILSNIKNE